MNELGEILRVECLTACGVTGSGLTYLSCKIEDLQFISKDLDKNVAINKLITAIKKAMEDGEISSKNYQIKL